MYQQSASYNSGPSSYSNASSYAGQSSVYAVQGGYSSHNNYAANSEGNIAPYQDMEPQHAASIAEVFLEEQRPWTPIIEQSSEVAEVIKQTFERITGQVFPQEDIKISVVSAQVLHQAHNLFGGCAGDGLRGFSLNRYGKGTSEIFVKEDHLDSVLLTIGHEIGHVLSPSLPSQKDEEAKAHAFSIAWMECIRDNNICGLKPNIRLNPARNGLHDVAYDFVQHLLRTGASALDIFKTLAQGLTSMIARIET